MLSIVGRLAIGLVLFCLDGSAQTPLVFEAASIRRSISGGVNTQIRVSGGRLTIQNASLKTLVRNAYDILAFQLAGEPRWMDTEMYDIMATTGTADEISPDRYKTLLQALLAERFAFQAHWETREGPVYALLVAKTGSKLKVSSETGEPSINTRKGVADARMEGARAPVSLLAGNLGNQLSRFVIDKTGLSEKYDWMLEWSPNLSAASTHPSLFTAVQEQLGLKLDAEKGPMQVLVIDRVERASEN